MQGGRQKENEVICRMMTFQEYRKMLEGVPYTAGLEYRPAYMWLHRELLPLGLWALQGCRDNIIRIPPMVENTYGRRVPVITVFRNAFRGNETVTDILLPSGVDRLPDGGAFAGCKNLKRITIPRGIDYIGPGTFDGCSSLEDVYYEGTPEEWNRIHIVSRKHEIEFGALVPGSPVESVTAERLVHIPGNDALLTANIHFRCDPGTGVSARFNIYMGGKDITGLFEQG